MLHLTPYREMQSPANPLRASREAFRVVRKVVLGWGEAGASTQRADTLQIDLLARYYTFRGQAAVRGFLERHPSIVALLAEAFSKISHYFAASQIFLEVFDDPESLANSKLFVSIATSLGPDEALDTLDSFNKDVGLNILHRGKGKLAITVEFQ